MKKTAILVGLLASAIGASAQGTVQFVNNITGVLRAPVYGVEPSDPTISKVGNTSGGTPAGAQTYGGTLLSGTGFTSQLWGHVGMNQPLGTLDNIATSAFRTGAAAGFWTAVTAVVPNAPLDGQPYHGTFQVRAWDNRGGTITSWAMVLADATVARGQSPVFSPSGNLGGTGTPPATAPPLEGLVSFNLFTPVPEPSVIALGALGLGALLFRRIRK